MRGQGLANARTVQPVAPSRSQARTSAEPAGRIAQMKAPYPDGSYDFVIAYISSLGGLKGERDLRDRLRSDVSPHVFDMAYQGHLLGEGVEELAQALDGQLSLSSSGLLVK